MSTSEAQIVANHNNGRLSIGPTTENGKQVSARNSLKHGFLARILPAESAEYADLLDGLAQSLNPECPLQHLLVEEIALLYVRLRRIHKCELRHLEPAPENYDHTKELPYMYSPLYYYRDKHAQLTLRYETACQRHRLLKRPGPA